MGLKAAKPPAFRIYIEAISACKRRSKIASSARLQYCRMLGREQLIESAFLSR
jgi:hypothetical protein